MSAQYDTDVISHDDTETTVLNDLFESLESMESLDDLPAFEQGPSASAFITRPELELEELMPDGPYTLRILGHVYGEVDRGLLMELLRRGLLVGAEVWCTPNWLPFSEHPDFGAIQAHLTAELERVVERKRPRELTPQPHWRTPEDIRQTDEVTRPHISRDAIDGAPAPNPDFVDDSRQTAEFDPEPFRAFAAGLDSEHSDAEIETSSATERLEDDALRELQASLDAQRLQGSPQVDQPDVSQPDVSQPMPLTDVADEAIIATCEMDSPVLASELPTRERQARGRRPSPLEGSRSAATNFPTSVSGYSTSQSPAPMAAIVKPRQIRRDVDPSQTPDELPLTSPPETSPPAQSANAQVARQEVEQRRAPRSTEPLQRVTPSRRTPTWLVFLGATAIVLAFVALVALAVRYAGMTTETPTTPAPKPSPAVNAARQTVYDSLPRTFADGRDAAAVAATLANAPVAERVWVLESLFAAAPSADAALQAAKAHLDAGDWDRARSFAAKALALGAPRDEAGAVFGDAVQSDESLVVLPPKTLPRGAITKAAMAADRVLVTLDDGTSAYFAPSLAREPDAHLPLLAAHTLCRLVDCAFELAATQHVRISPDALRDALVEPAKGNQLSLDDLNTTTTDEAEYVEGALVKLPGERARAFPIGSHEVWRPWLAAEDLDTAAAQSLRDQLGADASDAGATRELRRQLSSLLTFDYLVNNWTRLPDDAASAPTTLVLDGDLLSVRHSAAFATRSSKRVSGRFAWVEVFDRNLVARIRLLDPEVVDPLLFDMDDPISSARRDEFWKQREELLEVVEDAHREHGDAIWL
jgi:hypothetical protein